MSKRNTRDGRPRGRIRVIVGRMNLSVVIPAYNEERYLPRTLASVKTALAEIADAELIVVDNESTDRTREIAESFGARLVAETEHNIGKVRNTGGFAATGEVIVFLDADTRVRPGLFEKIIDAMADERCVGGSVAVEYERTYRRKWIRYYLACWQFWGRFLSMRQGAAQFCRKDIFSELGGYDTAIFLGEDIEFHWRLAKLAKKRGGHTAFIEEPRVLTSSRRYDQMGIIRTLIFTHPITIFLAWRRPSVWKDWYQNAIR
jgi:glycosyltransferase involved in cell wall biosynthesis